MSTIIFLQIFFVCLLGAMSPGPSMVVVINNAIFKNRYHGILTSIGHGIGIAIYAFIAVLGIGLIIKTNLIIFNGIKILSIMFLIYVGMMQILNKKNLDFNKHGIRSNAVSFLQGFSISILNPKIFIWFIAIYSQFMSNNNDFVFNAYLVLIAGFVDASWYIILTLAVTSSTKLSSLLNKSNIIHKIIGLFLVVIGIFLLYEVLNNILVRENV